MVVGLAAVTLSILDRSARWLLALRPLLGIAWLLLLVLPWFIAIYLRVGEPIPVASVGERHACQGRKRAGGAWRTAGALSRSVFCHLLSGSMLAGLAAPAVWAVRREPAARFLLAWLVPSWIVFELVVTKLPHYVLPLYPAIAILIAGAVESKVLSQRPWLVRGVMWWFLVPIIVSIVAVTGAIIIDRDLALLAWPFFAAAIVCGLFAWQLYDEDGAERAFMRATAAAVLMAIGIYAVIVPSLDPAFPSVALARRAARFRLRATGRRQRRLRGAEPGLPCRHQDAFHRCGRRGRFPARRQLPLCLCRRAPGARLCACAPKRSGLRYSRGPRVDGYNISIGQPITIAVFQSAARREWA